MNQQIKRRQFLTFAAATALGASGLGRSAGAQSAFPGGAKKRKPMNVLFLVADDLRPALGCYGDAGAKTPCIDALAQSGTTFERCYCQQAVCAPSRNSMLTGLRPESLDIYDLQTYFRTKVPDVVTLPQHFKASGYTTARIGKIYHTYHGNREDVPSWSFLATRPGAPETVSAASEETPKPKNGAKTKPAPYAWPDVQDSALEDGQIADGAIEWLRHFKKTEQPFFLGVGFLKPHLAFVAPKKYWNLHANTPFTPSPDRTPPLGAPAYATHGVGELATYAGIAGGQNPVPDEEASKLIHGYYATTSYMDAQLGRVLAELDRLGLRENTLVVFWGDHGFQLGENGEWAKQNNLELATRSPLIVSAPGFGGGQKTLALTELVDIYPSLCELAGLRLPPHLQGTSFVPLLKKPARAWKSAAFSCWPRGGARDGVAPVGMGRAMRTDRFRFVEWTHTDGVPTACELYDYQTDPREDLNLATLPENAALVEQMKLKLHAGWKGALPLR